MFKLKRCLNCNNIFDRPLRPKSKFKISWCNYKKMKFCSRKCYALYQKIHQTNSNNPNWKGGKTKCIDCGKLLSARYSYRPTKRCKKCWIKFMKGENHPNWKGGTIIDKSGYRYIHKPNHPFCGKHGYIFEHRLIAEKCLGRYLKPEETIHHINKIKNDNHPENLYLFPNTSEHRKNEKNPTLKSNLF